MSSNELRNIFTQHGFQFNAHDGAYVQGKSYGHVKKLEVAAALTVAHNSPGGGLPNISAIQQQCKVGWHFVRKIEDELTEYGRVLEPNEKPRQYENIGPGSRTLDELDAFIILQLYLDDPSHGLPSYVRWLKQLVGTEVSRFTVS